MQTKIGIIGASVSGLCCAKQILEQRNCQVTVFEQNAWIGGLWHYDPNPNANNALYESLRTNLSLELMEFPDFTMKTHNHTAYSDYNLFPNHKQVLSYLKQYVSQFNLMPHIKLQHKVVSLRQQMEPKTSKKTFNMTVKNIKNNTTQDYTFDAIVVCNGHYSECYIPNIDKFSQFPFNGIIMHSRYYRRPNDVFDKLNHNTLNKNQMSHVYKWNAKMKRNIVIVGNKSSGFDLSRELYLYINKNNLHKKYQIFHISQGVVHNKQIGDRLFLKHRKPWMESGSYHFVQRLTFDTLENDKAVFKYVNTNKIPIVNNGVKCSDYNCSGMKFDDENKSTSILCDLCLFCTGYYYDFPFLLNDNSDDEFANYFNKKTYIPMLYDGIFFAPNPMLSFVGIHKKTVPFLVTYYQCLYVAYVVSGVKKLPTKDEILNYRFIQSGNDVKLFLGESLFDYIAEICHKLGIERPKNLDVWRKAYLNTFITRYQHVYNIRLASKL